MERHPTTQRITYSRTKTFIAVSTNKVQKGPEILFFFFFICVFCFINVGKIYQIKKYVTLDKRVVNVSYIW